MKKLLYTLLLGFIVVSCTQDDLNADNVSVLVPEQEITVDINSFEATLDRLISINKGLPEKASNVTGKDAVIGTSYIYLLEGSQGSSLYEFSFSDDVGVPECGIPSGFEGFYIYLVDGGVGLAFDEGSENVIATLNGNYTFLFQSTYNNGVKIKNRSIEVANRTDQSFVFPTGS